MKTKRIKISELKIGMKIKSIDLNGNIVFQNVENIFNTYVPKHERLILKFKNGTQIKCSSNHPIIIKSANNILQRFPKDLTIKDDVITENGITNLLSIENDQSDNPNYIDITVANSHVFFTSDSKDGELILTHNSQGGLRNASATINLPIWHYQFDDYIVMKNNKGTDETRVRQLDYCVVISSLFWRRLKNKGNITFFDPNEVPDLYEAFYSNINVFNNLYIEYENKKHKLRTKTVSVETVFKDWILTERMETGRIYFLNIDNVSNQGPFNTEKHPIYQTNLCTEIMLPTQPFETIDDIGECVIQHNGEELRIPNDSIAKLSDGTTKLVHFIDEDDDILSFVLKSGEEIVL